MGPMLRLATRVLMGQVEHYVTLRRAVGFRSDFNRRLDKALSRWVERFKQVPEEWKQAKTEEERTEIEQQTHIIPDLAQDAEAVRTIVMGLAEIEIAHFPEWFRWLMQELKTEGLI